jgi:HEAT repeat protein
MSLAVALRAIESEEEGERERAIPVLVTSGNPEALLALEKVATQDDNLQLRFLAKEGALALRKKLTGSGKTGTSSSHKQLDLNHLKLRLKDADPKRRLRGVRSALATKDTRALKYLRQLLPKEPDPKVASELCMCIGVLGKKGDSQELLAALKSPHPRVRVGAIRGLSYLRDRSVYPTLVAMLQDKDKDVRAKAFETLLRLGKPRLLRLLVRMLGSSRKWSRKAAVRACAKITSKESAEILMKARAQDPDSKLRKEATRALLHLARKGNATAAAALAREPAADPGHHPASTNGLVLDQGPQHQKDPALAEIERLRAEVALARAEAAQARQGASPTPPPAAPPENLFQHPAAPGQADSSPSSVSATLPQPPLELLNLDDDDDPDVSELEDLELSTAEVMLGGLNDPSPEVRMDNVIEILAQRDRDLAPQLAARLPLEEDSRVLGKLILAIGKLGRAKDARRLVRFLTSSEKRIRANTVEALSTLGDAKALRACIPLLEDEDNRTRANAVVALQGISDVDVVTVLKQMAKHPSMDMRLSAIYAALEVGGTEVDPVLDFLLRDKEQEVKDKALKALTLLEDQRMAPMHGVIPDVNASLVRIEKLSAWRGGEVEEEEEHDSLSRSHSKSLDEEAAELLGRLSGDNPTEDSLVATQDEKSTNWGRKPATTMGRDSLLAPGSPIKAKWQDFLEYLTNPSPPPKKKSNTASGDADSQTTILVIGGTFLVVVLIYYFFFMGSGGAEVMDIGDF